MQIVAGKFYRTRDGRKVGPITPDTNPFNQREWPWTDGRSHYGVRGNCSTGDYLVSEWTDDLAPVAQQDEQPNSTRPDASSSLAGGAKSVYRVGDEIEVRLKVEAVEGDNTPLVGIKGQWFKYIDPSAIVRHIPAPRPIEIGCKVRAGQAGYWGVVKAIDGPDAWVLWESGSRLTSQLADLTRVVDTAAA